MNYNKAFIPLPKDFAFDIFDGCGMKTPTEPVLHFHDCLEINYVKEGTGINYIENIAYPLVPGDFYVINNLEQHMSMSDGSLKLTVILFDPVLIWQNSPFDYEYLKPFFNRSICFSNRISSDNPFIGELLYICKKIENEWCTRLEGYKMVIKALLMELLAILYRHFKTVNAFGEDVKSFRQAYDRIRDVLNFIHDNFRKDLTLDELSGVALMNRTYFSSYFKKVMGVSLMEYIEDLRINYACLMLKTTTKSITSIALECGFKNVSHFNRVFKGNLNVTPREYRLAKTEY